MKPKRIIDVCCGSKMFWLDRNNPEKQQNTLALLYER